MKVLYDSIVFFFFNLKTKNISNIFEVQILIVDISIDLKIEIDIFFTFNSRTTIARKKKQRLISGDFKVNKRGDT